MKNKQYVIHQFHEDIRLATKIIERPIPDLGDFEVLIRNKYVGVNAIYDRELYKGNVPYIKVEFPSVFGVEAVGEIVAKGDLVEGIQLGQAVSTVKVGSAYQQFQVVDASNIIFIPNASPEYLAINPTGISAHLALEQVADLQEGQTVVVSAAAGGLGHILVQLCKMKNCQVIAICGSEQKVEMLNSLNCCDRIINYREEAIAEVLNKEYNNNIDVAIDSVGGQIFDTFLANLAPLGKLIVVGLASELSRDRFEKIHRARVYESIYWKGASVQCFMNHLYKDKHPEARNHLFSLYQNGNLQIKIDPSSFQGIASIQAASQYLLAGKSCGKVVVAL